VQHASGLPADPNSATMMEKLDAALNNMSHGPDIAEGVETEQQRAFLAKTGCGIQGYLIGRPEPIAHYQHLVTAMAATRETAVIAG